MIIQLKEAIDLEKIMESGQCFRMLRLEQAGLFRVIHKGQVLYVEQRSDTELALSCTEDEWEKYWFSYFDMQENYTEILEKTDPLDTYLQASIHYGRGIRLLRQAPFEMLISFIVSQRKSIPAIRTSIEKLCEGYGEQIETEHGIVYSFPSPERILEMSDADLRACSLGYRAPYVRDAAEKVCSGVLDLDEMHHLSDEELFEKLCMVKGVGKKVANCIMLFAYHRIERVPEDVWVNRIITSKYQGVNPFPSYEKAGILQQFMFFYAISHRNGFK